MEEKLLINKNKIMPVMLFSFILILMSILLDKWESPTFLIAIGFTILFFYNLISVRLKIKNSSDVSLWLPASLISSICFGISLLLWLTANYFSVNYLLIIEAILVLITVAFILYNRQDVAHIFSKKEEYKRIDERYKSKEGDF